MQIRMWRERNELPQDRKPDGWFISASIHVVFICGLILLPGPSGTPVPYTREVVTPLVYVPPRPHTPLQAPPVRVRRDLPVPKIKPPEIPPATAPPQIIAKRMAAPVPVERPRVASIAAPEPVQQASIATAPIQTADLKDSPQSSVPLYTACENRRVRQCRTIREWPRALSTSRSPDRWL